MTQNTRLFVLGASDPEMQRIETVLSEEGEDYVWAKTRSGTRVTSSEAYAVDGTISDDIPSDYDTYIVVETFGPAWLGVYNSSWKDTAADVIVVDHHLSGQPGFSRPPAEYMEASSLGQILTILGRAPTPEDRLIAAADHCLGAAYAGKCPAVDPAILREWRVAILAKWRLVEPDYIREAVLAAVGHIQRSPKVGGIVRLGPTVPELPEAAAILGEIVEYLVDLDSLRPKIGVVGGNGSVEAAAIVQKWIDAAPQQGITDVYGDSVRGYAGGYLSDWRSWWLNRAYAR